MALGPTYDYEAEKAGLDRRQQLINALQQQALQPLNLPRQGSVQAAASPLAAIGGPIAQALIANYAQGQQKEQQAELTSRYKQDLSSGIEKFMNTSQGSPAVQASLPNPFDGTSRTEQIGAAVPGDPKKAMLEALASNHPVLQQLGMSQLQGMGKKDQLSKKDLLSLSGYDAKSRIAAALAGDESLLTPEVKEHVVNNQIVSGIPGERGSYKPIGDFRDRFDVPGQVAVGP
jgi:hypothetical protein